MLLVCGKLHSEVVLKIAYRIAHIVDHFSANLDLLLVPGKNLVVGHRALDLVLDTLPIH